MLKPNIQNNLGQIASNPANSVWVFASAGSGKTTILTNRVLRLLLEDVAPNKILCLTFTKVGASEMEDRINEKLASWVLCDDEELVEKLRNLTGNEPSEALLRKARTLFHKILDDEFKIKIQTIHGFCQNLIKIFPFEAKINPNFELIEETGEKLLLEQARREILNDALYNQELRGVIEEISRRIDDESLIKLSQKLLDEKEKIGELKEEFFDVENIEKELRKRFGLGVGDDEKKIIEEFFGKLEGVEKFVEALENSDSSKNKESLEKIKKALVLVDGMDPGLRRDDKGGKLALLTQHSSPSSRRRPGSIPSIKAFDLYSSAFLTQKNEPRAFYKKVKDEFAEFIEDQRKLIAEFLDKLNSLTICNDSILLLKFVDKILENYQKIKTKNSYLDYNDLIDHSNKLLANPEFRDWVKLKMDSSFDHILIDESQDTNHQQWDIIKALTEDFFSGLSSSNLNRSIFIVGDEKQSIYSFQGAEPHISEEIFTYFYQRLGEKLKKIELNNSFRSLESVLLAVDKVFSNPLYGNAITKINKFHNHLPIRSGSGKVEIWPQIFNEEKEKNNSLEWKIDFAKENKINAAEKLAKIIALKIQNLNLENGVKYSEIMVLLRTRKNDFSHKLIKFFHQFQIPFTTKKDIYFEDNLLLQDLISLARFVLLPIDDLNLAALLKSPFFNISEKDLLEICLHKNAKQSNIYNALQELEKFNFIKNELDEYIKNSANIYDFFDFAINKNREKFVNYFGVEALEILDKFLLLVFDFKENYTANLQQFLSFIKKTDLKISLNGLDADAVRVSTIHGSKGLEAKIVFIPDCAYNVNKLPNNKENIFYLDNFPIWRARRDKENRLVEKIRLDKFNEEKEEYLRLLYVAMTRAKDELYIAGFGDEVDAGSWYEIVKNAVPEFVVGLPELEETNLFQQPSSLARQGRGSLAINAKTPEILGPDGPRMTVVERVSSIAEIRGKLIHKILEIFGKNHHQEKSWLKEIAQNLISQNNFLDEKQKNEIASQVNNFLDSELFEKIFFAEIKCEMEIIFQNSVLRLDLMRVAEDGVLIIDYKSEENMPKTVPQEYVKQLERYKEAVLKIYPDKKISTAILWTKFLEMSWL